MTDEGKRAVVETALAGIVVTAQAFNPSIFNETWLTKNDLILPDSLTGLRLFSEEIAQFETKEFRVLVTPPKMQVTFSLQRSAETGFQVEQKIVTRVVELLPHTPYQALGLNFDYLVVPPKGREFPEYNRALFGTGDYRLLGEFSTADARFGRYFSKNHEGARLRLDIKPMKQEPGDRERLHFSFNFHHDVTSVDQAERFRELVRLVGNWNSVRKYSERLVKLGTKV